MNIEIMKNVYEKHKNLKLAANEIGVKWQTLYYHLKENNIPVTGDKSKYGSATDKLAAKAELYFKELIPYAKNNNDYQYQAKVDFMVGNLKVDIKSSELHFSSKKFKSKRWAFSVKKQEFQADFIVAFGYENDNVTIFLFPSETIRYFQTVSINPYGKSKWLDYSVTKDELIEFFGMYNSSPNREE